MKPLLNANSLKKIYDKNPQLALDTVSLQVQKGEFLGIMGASGSGKTTLLNVLSTIDKPTSGTIEIDGVFLHNLKDNAAADFRRDCLGFIFQEYFLLDSLTVRENIAVPLTLCHVPPEKIDTHVQGLAQRFGIAHLLDSYPDALSGGQRQRTVAARALIKNPKLLFADEPTGALDSASSSGLLEKLSEINTQLKTTILMVTHDAIAASFAHRILIFKDGSIVGNLLKEGNSRSHFYQEILKTLSSTVS